MGRNFVNWLTQIIGLKKHYGLLALQVEIEWKKAQSIVSVGFLITKIETDFTPVLVFWEECQTAKRYATQYRVIQTYVVNFICQKVQTFWADSDSLCKINDKKIFKNFFFQCLALPKDPQSFCPYVVKAKKNVLRSFSNLFFIY